MDDTKHILIVDDEASVLYVMQNSLRKLGSHFQVSTAPDGIKALDLLRQRPFDLVITDYKMAGMDGLELIGAIREIRPNTRVILITAYGSDAVEAEARRLQAYRFLTKPLEISTFRQIVQEALDDIALSRPGILILSDNRYQEIIGLLEALQTDVGARCIFLTDTNGRLIARTGDVGNMQVEEIASLLCGGMATLQEAGRVLDRDENAIHLTYREGQEDNLYAINIGQQLLLIVIIEQGTYSSRLGSVWYYAQQTAVTLHHNLNETDQTTTPNFFDEQFDEAFDSELDKLFE